MADITIGIDPTDEVSFRVHLHGGKLDPAAHVHLDAEGFVALVSRSPEALRAVGTACLDAAADLAAARIEARTNAA